MALYIVTIGNTLDDTVKVKVILSNEPLTVNNVPKYLLDISEDWGEYIESVEVANVIMNAWDINEQNEMERLIKQL